MGGSRVVSRVLGSLLRTDSPIGNLLLGRHDGLSRRGNRTGLIATLRSIRTSVSVEDFI